MNSLTDVRSFICDPTVILHIVKYILPASTGVAEEREYADIDINRLKMGK